MTHALPRHVGDVQQAVDAAEVDERAVLGEVLDDALDDRAFLQALEQLFALRAECSSRRPRGGETTTLLRLRSSLMTLNSSSLPSRYTGSRTGRTSTSEPGRNARTSLMSTVKPPLTLPDDKALDGGSAC